MSAAGIFTIVQIILIDILLAGDNAIVIGMATSDFQAHTKKLFLGYIWCYRVAFNYGIPIRRGHGQSPSITLVGHLIMDWLRTCHW